MNYRSLLPGGIRGVGVGVVVVIGDGEGEGEGEGKTGVVVGVMVGVAFGTPSSSEGVMSAILKFPLPLFVFDAPLCSPSIF